MRNGSPQTGVARLAVIVATLALLMSACAADWTSRLFDAGHGSATSDDGLTASNVGGLSLKWRLQAPGCPGAPSGGGWLATPVTLNGVIYIGSNFGCLYAINESDKSIKWKIFTAFQQKLTCNQQLGIVSSVVVRDEGAGPVLYFHSPDGFLYKLKGSDGSTIWRKEVQIPSTTANDVYAWSSPTVANGMVIVGVSSNCDRPFVQGQVRVYDSTDGHFLWAHKTIPDGFVGAGDWYDAAVDGSGNIYVSTGSTSDATASAHPNTTDGFEQYSILKIDSGGHLVWKAPAPKHTGDPDYGSSPILFTGNGVALVGATNKDGWFRAYRQDNGAEVWQALVGTANPSGYASALSGGVWDGTRLFVMGNATNTGGTWGQFPAGVWSPQNGAPAAGAIRQLDPSTGNLVAVGGRPFELPLPSNPLGPCSINGKGILICAGGHVPADLAAHDNGLFIVDTTQPAAVLRHLEDVHNYSEFPQPVQENGLILAANTDALVKWGQ
jgi:outer membrane protein assembly factor BamB